MLQECACGQPLLDNVKKCPQCGEPNAVYRHSRWKIFWPDVETELGAAEATRFGYLAAFGVTALTLVAVPFGALGTSVVSLVDAAVFALLGLGIWRKWRTAAVLALLIFSVNVVFTVAQGGGVGVLAVLILVSLINGVRGTFAHARITAATRDRSQRSEASASDPSALR